MLENVLGGANDLMPARICLRREFRFAAQPPPLLATPCARLGLSDERLRSIAAKAAKNPGKEATKESMSDTRSELTVSLWRGAQQGRYETYKVPWRENQTVLDVVTFV